jgi:hypothetical protein
MFGTKGLAAGRPQLPTPPTRPAAGSQRFDVSWKPLPSALAALFFAVCLTSRGCRCWTRAA